MILELALAAFALSATELYQHGIALFEKGDPQAAAHRFEEARALAPKDARIWRALGVSYAAMLDHQRATEPFRQACTLDPALTDACYYYGRNLYALNRFEPAIAALNKGMRAARSPWQVHLGLAQAYEGLGDAKQSEPAYRKAIAMFEAVPRQERGRPDFDPRLRLAIFLYRQGRADDALQWAQTAAADWPTHGPAHLELGRILHQQGKLEAAATSLEKAVENGGGPPAHLMLGRVYLRLGRTTEAERHLTAGANSQPAAP